MDSYLSTHAEETAYIESLNRCNNISPRIGAQNYNIKVLNSMNKARLGRSTAVGIAACRPPTAYLSIYSNYEGQETDREAFPGDGEGSHSRILGKNTKAGASCAGLLRLGRSHILFHQSVHTLWWETPPFKYCLSVVCMIGDKSRKLD